VAEENGDSRVLDWIGGFPERWEVGALGAHMRPNRSDNRGMKQSRVLSLSYGRVIVKPEEKLRGLVPASFETYQVLEPGDIVIRPTDLQNDRQSLRVGQTWLSGIITSAYISVRPLPGFDSRYAAYLLSAYDFLKVFYGFGSGLRQNLDFRHIKRIPIPIPPEVEQRCIVRYLDHAELRIARAIASKGAVLSRLSEARAAVVAGSVLGAGGERALHGGLGYLVPDSWDVAPFWSVAPEISISGVVGRELLSVFLGRGVIRYSESSGQVHKPSLDLSKYQLVLPGDLVLNNQQAWRGSVGVSSFEGIVSPAYIVCRLTKRLDAQYANFLFRSPALINQFVLASRGVGSIQRQVHRQSLRNVRVPIPPVEEQVSISNMLRDRTAGIDSATESVRQEIALLKEYRVKLISDVVTGKLDVTKEAEGLRDIDPVELAQELAGLTGGVGDDVEDEEGGGDGDD